MINSLSLSAGDAVVTALLGYTIVFFGLVMLMFVVMLMGRFMHSTVSVQPSPAAAEEVKTAPKARGTAGELRLYDTDPRDAAMIMAIVADSLGKPINELRFISIREVRKDEV